MANQKNNQKNHSSKNTRFQKTRRIVSSVVIAIIVWFVIVNVVNPKITITMTDIPVTFVGENDLRDRGFVVVDKDKLPQFSVKVRGTRNDLISAMNRVYLEIDLDGIGDVGKITVAPTVKLPGYISLEKQKFSTIDLNIEPGYEKEIPVIVVQEGDEKLRYKNKIIKSAARDEKVIITGSKSATDQVDACVVRVDVSQIVQSGTTVYVSTLVDKDFNETMYKGSVFYTSTIPVTNKVYERHTVPVKIETDPELDKAMSVTYDKEALDKLTIDIGVVAGEKAPEHIKAIIPNKDYQAGRTEAELSFLAPEGVYVQDTLVTVPIEVEKYTTRKLDVTVELKNIPSGLRSDNTKITKQMELKVPESLKDEIKAYVDCSELGAGEHQAKVLFSTKHVSSKEEITVKIKLMEK